MSGDRTILVLGGTGQQGGATARHLLRRGWTVQALVRDPRKDAAQALAQMGAVLVRGDMEDEASLTAAMTGVHGVFSVQTFVTPGGVVTEERQGKKVAEAAARTGVGHVVYTSVGGAERDTGIPHFESKRRIEQRIAELGLPATILRPTMFYECFNEIRPRPMGEHLVLGLWLEPQVPVQLVATDDIGAFAADAFDDPDTWVGRELEIAGDELTGPQIAEVFERVSGIPTRYQVASSHGLRQARPDLADMFDWFNRAGYRADLPRLRRDRPELLGLEAWLRTHRSPPVDAVEQASAL